MSESKLKTELIVQEHQILITQLQGSYSNIAYLLNIDSQMKKTETKNNLLFYSPKNLFETKKLKKIKESIWERQKNTTCHKITNSVIDYKRSELI